jgi:hypothetical protein
MRHHLRLLIAVVILALGIGTVSVVAASSTPTANSDSRTRFEIVFHDTILTASSTALSLGDRFILNDDVLLGGETVGHNGGVCTVTSLAGELLCNVTWSLPDGTISTQFLNTPDPNKLFAITGGTGQYAGARGTGELVERGDGDDQSGGTGTVEFRVLD